MTLVTDDALNHGWMTKTNAPAQKTRRTGNAPSGNRTTQDVTARDEMFATQKEEAEMSVLPDDMLIDDEVETTLTENDFVDADLSVGSLPDAVQYYLQAIGRTALLNSKREIELARKIEVISLIESIKSTVVSTTHAEKIFDMSWGVLQVLTQAWPVWQTAKSLLQPVVDGDLATALSTQTTIELFYGLNNQQRMEYFRVREAWEIGRAHV